MQVANQTQKLEHAFWHTPTGYAVIQRVGKGILVIVEVRRDDTIQEVWVNGREIRIYVGRECVHATY